MRLIYLDEAGISHDNPTLTVAGVLIHGDKESSLIKDDMDALVEKYIPAQDQLGFVFHATDIYHGSRYFSRDKWPKELRWRILTELAQIIESRSLPVVAGFYHKDKFGVGILAEADLKDNPKRNLMQTMAAMDCALWADRWLEMFAPSENALITAEDTDHVKKLIKAAMQVFQSDPLMEQWGLKEAKSQFGLPLKRVIDTVHFTDKGGAKALQLADLCAFTLRRLLEEKHVPLEVGEIVVNHMMWIQKHPLINKKLRDK